MSDDRKMYIVLQYTSSYHPTLCSSKVIPNMEVHEKIVEYLIWKDYDDIHICFKEENDHPNMKLLWSWSIVKWTSKLPATIGWLHSTHSHVPESIITP